MLENRGNLVLLIGGAIIVVIGFLFYVWRQSANIVPLRTSLGTRSIQAPFSSNTTSATPEAEDKNFFSSISDIFRQNLNPVGRQGTEGEASFFAPPEKLRTAFLPPRERLEDLQKKLPSSRATSTPGLSTKDLRAKYFEALFPPVYLAYLKANQDFLVSENALRQEEKVQFKNEDEIFSFLKKFEAYLYAKRIIPADPTADFEREVLELQKLHTLEAQLLEAGVLKPARSSSFLNLKKFLASGLRALFGVGVVQAGELGRDDCWRGVGPNAVIGSEERTICCDCGIERIGKIVFPVPDMPGCKTFGGQCNIANFGCLNGPGYGGNVIWDSVSKICGFDAGGGLGFFGIIGKIFGVLGAIPGLIENLPGLGDTNFTGGIIQNVPGVEPGTSFPTPIIKNLPSGPELISI